jgi:flagellar FliJ protein
VKRKSAYELLLELTEQHREAKRRKLARSIEALVRAQTRKDVLQGYEAEYAAQAHTRRAEGASAPVMDNLDRFVDRLGEELATQQRRLVQEQGNARSAEEEVREAERRHRTLALLKEREQARRRRDEARREQKQHDEHAARFGRTRGGLG